MTPLFICSGSFNALNFELVECADAKGEKRPLYLLSKNGLVMVAMGYTGPGAMRVKKSYIAFFIFIFGVFNFEASS